MPGVQGHGADSRKYPAQVGLEGKSRICRMAEFRLQYFRESENHFCPIGLVCKTNYFNTHKCSCSGEEYYYLVAEVGVRSNMKVYGTEVG